MASAEEIASLQNAVRSAIDRHAHAVGALHRAEDRNRRIPGTASDDELAALRVAVDDAEDLLDDARTALATVTGTATVEPPAVRPLPECVCDMIVVDTAAGMADVTFSFPDGPKTWRLKIEDSLYYRKGTRYRFLAREVDGPAGA